MSETVIVIGAGSSIDIVGRTFPSGPALLAEIGELLMTPDPDRQRPRDAQLMLELCSHSVGGVSRFLEIARRIVPLARTNASIDQLITFANDPDVSIVAKTCIGYIIGRAEAAYKPEHSGNWILDFLREYLARARTLDQALEKLNRLTFVVFNYDRVIEANLWMFLRDRFELKPEVALRVLSDITVIHPYGQLGAFVLGATTESAPVPNLHFKTDFPLLAVHMVNSIRTFDESLDEAIPTRIRAAVDGARNLVFVGFGFGDENLDLIAPQDNQGAAKTIYATKYTTNERRWANLEAALIRRLIVSADNNRQSSLKRAYDRGRTHSVQSCHDLVDYFSLEW